MIYKVANMRNVFFGFLLVLTSSVNAESSIIDQVTDLSVLKQHIEQDKAPLGKTLVIFDIDDTLLEANHFVGSDKWYNWQKGRHSVSPTGEKISIKDSEKFGCISSLLSTFFELGSTHLTQKDAVDIVNELSTFDTMLLTARTTSYRISTERELKRFSIDLSNQHLLDKNKGILFDLNDGNRIAKVTYQNGVVLSSGLNKGKVLEEILKRTEKSYEYIYFIDDSEKNIRLMHEAWKNKKVQLKNFHYTRVDKSISSEEIAQSNAIKKQLDEFIQIAYPKKAQIFSKGRCN